MKELRVFQHVLTVTEAKPSKKILLQLIGLLVSTSYDPGYDLI